MFYNCYSLISLNLNNFQISNSTNTNYTFDGCNQNVIYCFNNSEYNFLNHNFKDNNNNCSHICFSNSKKIILDLKQCVSNCSEEINYNLKYNDICYKTCPKKTKKSEKIIYVKI